MMAITSVKIHPAIGVARVGNSPDEFFIGPERRWEHLNPTGGFKDAQCRVKRQGARFRVFAYHDDGSVTELTSTDAKISWTVHLANRKAVGRNSGSASNLVIEPGARTIEGPNKKKAFDTGSIQFSGAPSVTVPLGEIRTDTKARLVVLGGFGKSASPLGNTIAHFYDNPGWYDDISDGPVTAHVKINGSGEEFDAAGAWVLVAPPKFSVHTDNVISLYDTLFQLAVDQGWIAAPGQPSYTSDVFPILDRARKTNWVENVPVWAHGWPDPVYDAAIRHAVYAKLLNAGGNMPRLNGVSALTATQFAAMQAWRDGNFAEDWAGPPAPSAGALIPAELDRVALDNCVGAAFYPGIEAGGITANPIINPANFLGAADPLRLNQAVLGPGSMSEFMALPWQADFKACGSQWWPVPRPTSVFPQGSPSRLAWDRDVLSMEEMVDEWYTLGFIVEQNGQYVEVDRCDAVFINLLTPHLHYQDVPQGPMGMARRIPLATAFEVRSPGAAVTLERVPGSGPANPRLSLPSSSVSVGPTVGPGIATARLWVVYETGPVDEVVTDQLQVRNPASGQTWTILLTANTVARKTVAAALVLDRSGSMSEDRGDGQTKYDSLKEAASIFVDVMVEGDGVGLVRYNQDAQPLQGVTTLGAPDDPGNTARQDTKNVLTGGGLTPDGSTSIGDGIFEGRLLLDAASGFDLKSLVVLTDGKENSSRWISDVAPQINEQTYAIGLGTPQNTSAAALQTLTGNHGGYLLITGAITGDNQFILQKYFLQILAGISNAEIVLDPSGLLVHGIEQRIPFLLTDADAGVDVILLTKQPTSVDFRLQTPNGFILEPWRAIAEPAMHYVLSEGVSYYRLVLPVELFPARFDQAGRWHALLTIGRPRLIQPAQVRDPRLLAGAHLADLMAPIRRLPPLNVAGTPVVQREIRDTPVRAMTHGSAGAGIAEARRVLPFSLLFHSYSSLSFRASLSQSGFEPGAKVTIEGSITESGLPTQHGAQVWVEIVRPGNPMVELPLQETEPGRFSGSFVASSPGVYACRTRASGRTTAGYPFEREQTLTAAVWRGGNRDADPDRREGGPLVEWVRERDQQLYGLLRCLLGERGLVTPEFERRLREAGVDLERVRGCFAEFAKSRGRDRGGDLG
jgi:hypothetical protein